MTSTNTVSTVADLAARDLVRSGLQGKVVMPGDGAYDRAREIWNGAVEVRPALFAKCVCAKDVQITVRVARKNGLPLSVRCGGHDFAGRALRHDGVVIDLTGMRRVNVDTKSQVATIEGGAISKDVAVASTPHGLVAVTGNVGAVGMAGLTLGGGYSPLTPKYGLALDNLLGAEVVLANGELVRANAVENAELFWALRGGGGNFGVVTSMQIRLHRVPQLLTGVILFPWSEADSVLLRFAESACNAPEELGVTTCLLCGPDGRPCVVLAPTWCGEIQQGKEVIGGLERLGKSPVTQIASMTYEQMLHRFDAHVVTGRHYAAQTRWLSQLTPGVISKCIEATNKRTSPFSVIAWHHFRGAPTRVPQEHTAFGLRAPHFMTDILSAWEPCSAKEGEVHRQWARHVSEALAPSSLPGGYPNMLNPGDREQIPFAYGNNVVRLLNLKKEFDPDGIFGSAVPLPHQKAA